MRAIAAGRRLRLLGAELAAVVAIAAIGGCGSSAKQTTTEAPSDVDRATAVVQSFLTGVAGGDGETACQNLTGEAQRELADFLAGASSPSSADCETAIAQLAETLGPDEVAEVRDALEDVKTEGDRGEAEVSAAAILAGDLELARFADGWLIAAPVPLVPPEEPTEARAARNRSIRVPMSAQGEEELGTAEFVLRQRELRIGLDLEGLPSASGDVVLVLWLTVAPDRSGYPVSIIAADGGAVEETYPVPRPVTAAVASDAEQIVVSRSPANTLRGEIDEAVDAGAPVIPFIGDVVASGDIP